MRKIVNYLRLPAFVFHILIYIAFPIAVIAENLFPNEVTSARWANYGKCDTGEDKFFIFSGGFRGKKILCASTDSRQDAQIFYLFMECSVNGEIATYMGTAHYSEWYIEIDMIEYRGASGAPDVYIELERCED